MSPSGSRGAARAHTVIHVMTVPLSLRFLRGQVGWLAARGYDVHAITSPGAELEAFARAEGAATHAVDMPRQITPARDLVALARLWSRLRRVSPAIVHAHTPKGGLLGMSAAWLAGVPVRIYQVHGLPYMTATGFRRALLRTTERISCALATRVLAVSRSMRDEAVRSGLVRAGKIDVLLGGTANGIDAVLYAPATSEQRAAARRSAGIPEGARVIGFVGRLVGDKGVHELVEAWGRLRDEFPDAHLLLVGGVEERDPVSPATLERIRSDARVHETGWLDDARPLYAAMDVVALPTYREGFPTVPLEAAACGLPVVATRVPGCTDAVEDGVTGVLVPPRDAGALAAALAGYLRDPDLRRAHGRAGRERVAREFRQEALWEAIDREYRALLRRPRQRGAALAAKRALDVAAAGVGLAVTAPLLAGVAAALRVTTGGPALFVQERPGRGGRPFRLVKFRTMTDARDAAGRLLPDADRLTRLGRFLRATSLDELPQLWNVLRGDLSLVGPRPLLMQYLARYTPEQARRHDVLPGITGWAQIHGRNAIGWDERFALDVWYVDRWSLGLDLRILARTVGSVLRRHGISQQGHATMPEFMGSGAEDER